ncbi:HD-GYP domain-containing protein [Ideonella margarita]|uniref:HD domain-containing phosphohydrolase n=1 Tax=Ideonella margarita TaxID=2984191 RepID=A0ABU9C1B5_9BURK
MSDTVSVQALRVGMFVHLDVGWMAHPFPLSSFKIASAEQIETIQGLGLRQVRWSPERSDVDIHGVAVVPAGEGVAAIDEAATPAANDEQGAAVGASAADQAQAARRAAEAAAVQARRELAERVSAQQAALRQCERQYGEACRDLRRISDAVVGTPVKARESADMLTRALLDKMLVDGELCLRVLGEPGGDRHSAHAMNVTVISLLLARALELEDSVLMDIGVGALLHDVGKLALPDRVRLLHDDFTHAEAALYRDHVAKGVAQGQRMGLSNGALLVLAQHHELADGTGYPRGAHLTQISPAARIVAMVNTYDNLCNAAVPSKSLTPHEALSRMFAQSRNKFDADMLSGFIRLMGIYPPGSVVQLSDERYAMVMTVNAARPLKPRVLVYEAGVPADQALHVDLDREGDLGIRRSLKAAQLPARAAEYLRPRQRVAYFFDVEAPQPLPEAA